MSAKTSFIEYVKQGEDRSIYYGLDSKKKMAAIAKRFSEFGAPPSDSLGQTALEKAIHTRSLQYVMETLVLHTGSISRELAVACEIESVPIVNMLLNKAPRDTNCDRALKAAISWGNPYLLRLLMDYVHRSESKSSWTRTLEWSLQVSEQACQADCTDMIRNTLKKVF